MNQKIRVVGRTLFLFVALSICLGMASVILNANGTGGSVVIVNFNVPVDPGSSSFVASAVSYAIANRASAIVIEMNTPGGLLSDMLSIINSITTANQSGIPTYTFVVPNGLAASAGSYIAMATNKIFMASGSEIGPSTPIVVGGTALEQNHTEDAMNKTMASLAAEWGRNVTAASIDMVLNDQAFTANEALNYHLINGLANSLQDMLGNVSLSGAPQTTLSESLYNQFLSAISDSTLDGILILLGIVLIVLDFFHPTIVLTIAGVISLVIGLIGAEVIGASFLGYLLLAIAAVLIILEIKLGHGFAMMIGVVIGAVGIFYLAQGLNYVAPSPITDVTDLELSVVVVLGILAGLYLRWVIGPIRQRSKLTGPEALIGKIGTAVTDLKPDGEVRAGGVVWRARSTSGDIKKGESVRVKSMENLMLIVEKVEQKPSA
ncbi:MAG TPA: NfeD family protein [Candidatus Bathyarchaeia archaeon]|nr:NfeD family protein [Candidatus Bathyarchaeia archaeon]